MHGFFFDASLLRDLHKEAELRCCRMVLWEVLRNTVVTVRGFGTNTSKTVSFLFCRTAAGYSTSYMGRGKSRGLRISGIIRQL